MINVLLIFLGAVVLTFLFLAVLQPSRFSIKRSLVMAAPPAVIFAQVNDLQHFNAWSPWVKMDPDATIRYSGPQAGVDASMAWDGKKTGAGSMTIVQSEPDVRIVCRLDFLRPMKASNQSEFTFVPEGDATLVTWSMAGKNRFAGKLMTVLFNCDKMVGTQFAKGLAELKTRVESR